MKLLTWRIRVGGDPVRLATLCSSGSSETPGDQSHLQGVGGCQPPADQSISNATPFRIVRGSLCVPPQPVMDSEARAGMRKDCRR